MGLDHWLTAEVNIGAVWEHKGITGELHYQLLKLETIDYEIIQWRKANWIHNWFVKNVQNGNDDCGRYYLSREILEKFAKVCRQSYEILSNSEPVDEKTLHVLGPDGPQKETVSIYDKELVKDLLEPTKGFFFGSTEFSTWDIQELEDTAEEIEQELAANRPITDYYYSSSW